MNGGWLGGMATRRWPGEEEGKDDRVDSFEGELVEQVREATVGCDFGMESGGGVRR